MLRTWLIREPDLRTPALDLSMFTKSRFGGAHAALAKPNLSTARPRKATETHVTDPTEASTSTDPTERSFSTAPIVAVSAAASRTETDTASPVQLPRLWSEGFPPEDHKWILKSLLKLGPKGKLELQDHLKLWYFPPEPSITRLLHQTVSLPTHFLSGCLASCGR
ncbi:hypothetical protein KUCAC02_033549 [Chaenocephalus aceratus]|nr:hypothetical protein KUCAC02_033549 [Chaenocephalus aceratus]